MIAKRFKPLPEKNRAIELVYKTTEETTIEQVENVLEDAKISGNSFSFNNGELSITAFSEDEVIKIVNALKNSNYEYKERNFQNSRYLENSDRRAIYEAWLASNDREQNRKLSNACSKALAICEAAEEYSRDDQESERIEAAKAAAEKWDAEHLITSKQLIKETPEDKTRYPGQMIQKFDGNQRDDALMCFDSKAI